MLPGIQLDDQVAVPVSGHCHRLLTEVVLELDPSIARDVRINEMDVAVVRCSLNLFLDRSEHTYAFAIQRR